jgi:hypothetical protein
VPFPALDEPKNPRQRKASRIRTRISDSASALRPCDAHQQNEDECEAIRPQQRRKSRKRAYSCDFSTGQLSTIENGLAVPTAATLTTLAEGLETLPLDLLTFPEDSPREKLIDMTRGLSKKDVDTLIAFLRRSAESGR